MICDMIDTEELYLKDGKNVIRLYPFQRNCPYVDCYVDDSGKKIKQFDGNQIEFCYHEADDSGWSNGIDEYFNAIDLKRMADGIRSIIEKNSTSFQYSCQNDIFRVSLSYDEHTEHYTFTVELVEMLCRDYHIKISKTHLTSSELNRYIHPFFDWEKAFPVIDTFIEEVVEEWGHFDYGDDDDDFSEFDPSDEIDMQLLLDD